MVSDHIMWTSVALTTLPVRDNDSSSAHESHAVITALS